MAWTNSKVFRRTLSELFSNTQAWDFDVDAYKVALYNNTGTPDADATTDALQSYNGAASAWVVANEVSQAVTWPAGVVPSPVSPFRWRTRCGWCSTPTTPRRGQALR